MNIPPDDADGQPLTPTRNGVPQHSWPVINAVIARRDMKALDKMALLSLLYFANVKLGWKAWPSEARLFEMMGCDQKAGRKAIQRLEAAGVIRKARARQMHGPNVYWIDPVAACGPLDPKADHDPDADHEHDPKADAVLDPKTDHEHDPDPDHYHLSLNSVSDQTMQNSLGKTKTTNIAPDGALSVKRPGPILSKKGAQGLVKRIPGDLLRNLILINDQHQGRGSGDYMKQLETHVRFRGDRDWTSICWCVLWRCLQASDGWPDVENPGGLTAVIADGQILEDAGPFSQQAMNREIQAHNERVGGGKVARFGSAS